MNRIHPAADPHRGGSDPSQRGPILGENSLRHFIFGQPMMIQAYIRLLQARRCADSRDWSLIHPVPETGLIIQPTLAEFFAFLETGHPLPPDALPRRER